MGSERDLAIASETAEAHTYRDVAAGASAATAARLGLAAATIGGATVICAPGAEQSFWTRAVGLGVDGPVTADLVGEMIAFFRAHGVAETGLQIAPPLLPPDWAEICARFGLTPGAPKVKLARAAAVVPPAETALTIAPVTASSKAEAMYVLARGLTFDEDDIAGLMSHFDAWAARSGDAIVSTGVLAVSGELAMMFGGATLPEYRGRGGQSALLARRLSEAAQHGCTHVFASTWIPREGSRNPSLDNMRSAGFHVQYEQQNWMWRA
ncbi:GNAT family N-acetyltransferase [Catenuloplanes japonicus]|uniref:N-acetyltransferase n=1 Tax=Catenuloplanes japonicus TaxID=33876 RepID=UPI00068EC34D|nr:N-acetyltransferase [Catenuloplanes japonicus]